jgi:hypothetical protein
MGMSPFWRDFAERVGATAAAAGIGVAVQQLGDLPAWWAPVLVTVLTMAKGGLARYVGRKGTASLLPADRDPAAQ